MMEREYEVAPCRVIFTEGRFTEQAQAHHKAIPLVRQLEPEQPKRDSVGVLRHDMPRPRKVPREEPWRVKVTIEAIRKLRAEGKNIKEVAAQLDCNPNLVYKRIEQAGDKPDREQLNAVAPGTIYGWLEVIGQSRSHPTQGRIFVCWCKCGALTEAPYKALNNGARTSCGCKKPEKLAENPKRVKLAASLWRKHGLSEAARRMGCSRTGIYRLLVAGGVKWKESDSTVK